MYKRQVQNNLLLQHEKINIEDWGLPEEVTQTLEKRNCTDFFVSESGLLYIATGLGVYVYNKQEKFISAIKNVSNKVHSMRQMIIDDDVVISVKQDEELISSPSGKYQTEFISDAQKSIAFIKHYIDPLDSAVVYSCGWGFLGKVRKLCPEIPNHMNKLQQNPMDLCKV